VFNRYDDDSERNQLFLVNADGSSVRPLVVDDADDVDAHFSPDGRFVAFVGGPDSDGYIELVEVATHAHLRLTHDGDEYTPDWTADGRIVFAKEGDDEDLWVMDADGTNQQRLLGFRESDEWSPALSADGQRISYTSDRDSTPQVFVARANGSGAKRLTGVRFVASASGSRCTIWGTPGADVLHGTREADVICGLGGNDVILGLAGTDTLDGGPGDDRLVGGEGTDWFYGSTGNDVLESRDTRRESLDGGPGYDRAHADAGDWISYVEAWL
jgi:Ca2+-binding RTX toxin-like protein